MIIRDCLIITDDSSVIALKPDEMRHFQCNRVVHRSKLASGVLEKWGAPVVPLSDANASRADQRGADVNEKHVLASLGN